MKVELAQYHYNNLRNWNKTVEFYLDEMRVFENHLAMVVKSNTNKDILARIEHFQNQFILQKEQFDILQHDINEEKKMLSAEILGKKPDLNVATINESYAVEEKLQSAEKIFRETKTELNRFLSEVL